MSLIDCLTPPEKKGHPVYGVLTEEEFKNLQKLPAGGAGKAIRKKDPLWGNTCGDSRELKSYTFKATASCTIHQSETQTFTVNAVDEEQAHRLAGELADNHSWNNLDENPDDIDLEIMK